MGGRKNSVGQILIHTLTEEPRLGGTAKDHLVQVSMGKGAQMRSLSIPSPPILRTLGEVVLLVDCSHYKNVLPYIKVRPLPLVPISPRPLQVSPHEERGSVLLEPSSQCWNIVVRSY